MRLYEMFKHMFKRTILNEMAWADPINTGLDTSVWFGEVGGRHGPRIKISNIIGKHSDKDAFVITISPNPTHVSGIIKLDNESRELICDWIKLNYDILMKLYRAIESQQSTVTINHKQYNINYAFKNLTRKLK